MKEGENMFEWNQPYHMVMELKKAYIEKNKKMDTFDVKTWMEVVNEIRYNEIFENLHITQFNHYVLLKYNLMSMYQSNDMFENENSIYRECRSVVIDLKEEELVLTPFKKFFNLNEIAENKVELVLEKIKQAKIVEIVDKLDGSMQSARYYKGDFFLSGSQALDPNESWRVQNGYKYLTENHRNMLKDYPDHTFIFEYIGEENPHVVVYSKEQTGLYVIGMRNVYTGEQASYGELQQIASTYDVPMTTFEQTTLEELLEKMKVYQSHEKEGWIIYIDGHFIKLKCDDYVYMHRTLSSKTSANVLIQAIADETFDDLMSKLPRAYHQRIKEVAKGITAYVLETEKQIDHYFGQAPKGDRKEFMIWINQHVPREIRGYVANKYLGKPYHPLKTTHYYKKAKDIGLSQEADQTEE